MALEKILYVADPMCSWCWGFAPEIRKLRRHLSEEVDFALIMGGLRDGHTWNSEFRSFLRENWKRVHRVSSQPFCDALLEEPAFDYTTEPACRAVVTVREYDEALAFDALFLLQEAFYARSLDITSHEVIADVLSSLNIPMFEESFSSEQMRVLTRQDRNRARLYGASSFPSLVLLDDQGHLSVIRGYRTYEELTKALVI